MIFALSPLGGSSQMLDRAKRRFAAGCHNIGEAHRLRIVRDVYQYLGREFQTHNGTWYRVEASHDAEQTFTMGQFTESNLSYRTIVDEQH